MKPIKDGNKNLPPLFFLPPISGEATFTYQKLCSALKTPRKVFALDSPSLVNPLIVGSSIQAMAEPYLALIRQVQPKGPVHVMGWSSGGILAYEIASCLEAQGRQAGFLGIIDEIAPQLQLGLSNADHAKELIELMSYFSERHGFQLNVSFEDLKKLPKLEQINRVFKDLPLDLPIINMLQHVKFFMMNFLQYEARKLEKTPITVFRTEPTLNKVSRLSHSHYEIDSLGWNKYSTGYTSICELEGDHFSIIQSPRELAAKIDFCVRDTGFNYSKEEELELLRDLSQKMKKIEHFAEQFKFEEKPKEKGSKLSESSTTMWGDRKKGPPATPAMQTSSSNDIEPLTTLMHSKI